MVLTYEVEVFEETFVTTVTKKRRSILEWLNEINNLVSPRRYIGLDIRVLKNNVGVLQLAYGRRCLIVRVMRMRDPNCAALQAFLLDTRNVFVGVGVRRMIDILGGTLAMGDSSNNVAFMDVGEYAAIKFDQPNLVRAKVKELVETASVELLPLGKTIQLPKARNDWGRQTDLSIRQIKNATITAVACHEMAKWMKIGGVNGRYICVIVIFNLLSSIENCYAIRFSRNRGIFIFLRIFGMILC